MDVSKELWQANADLARACLEHPFVQGIQQGTLTQTQFAAYVGQDAFFLEAFARAYSLAATKAPDWEGFEAFHELCSGVLAELKLHQGYATSWGIDLHQITPSSATRRYTDFLMATAWSAKVGVVAVAMAPCMRLYAFLGQSLVRSDYGDNPYQDWIKTYSSPEFEALAQSLERLVDRYNSATAIESTSAAYSTYRYAMICERDFFTSALEV